MRLPAIARCEHLRGDREVDGHDLVQGEDREAAHGSNLSNRKWGNLPVTASNNTDRLIFICT